MLHLKESYEKPFQYTLNGELKQLCKTHFKSVITKKNQHITDGYKAYMVNHRINQKF